MDARAHMAKFPKKLWIGTYEFDVHFVPADHAMLRGENGIDLDGLTVFEPFEFYFADCLSLMKLLEMVRHELTHAVNFVADIEDGATEEDIARGHGVVWSQFSISNPRFERWWLSACVAVRKQQQGGQTVKERKE